MADPLTPPPEPCECDHDGYKVWRDALVAGVARADREAAPQRVAALEQALWAYLTEPHANGALRNGHRMGFCLRCAEMYEAGMAAVGRDLEVAGAALGVGEAPNETRRCQTCTSPLHFRAYCSMCDRLPNRCTCAIDDETGLPVADHDARSGDAPGPAIDGQGRCDSCGVLHDATCAGVGEAAPPTNQVLTGPDLEAAPTLDRERVARALCRSNGSACSAFERHTNNGRRTHLDHADRFLVALGVARPDPAPPPPNESLIYERGTS